MRSAERSSMSVLQTGGNLKSLHHSMQAASDSRLNRESDEIVYLDLLKASVWPTYSFYKDLNQKALGDERETSDRFVVAILNLDL
jgi:hypothetical protein